MLTTGFGYAQKNLREGIVITLSGDTLHGDIDYRTDAINAKQCVFYADGAIEAKTYLPGEISAYRFLDNGRYYVSRTVPTDDNLFEQTLFLEYLVRGQMSVYYLPDAARGNLYFFENKEGKLAIARSTPRNASEWERRQVLGDAYAMLTGGTKSQQMLWEKNLSPLNVTQLTAAYNNEVCPDGQCEIFKYRAKETPKADRSLYWVLKAGYNCYVNRSSSDKTVTMTVNRPAIIDPQLSYTLSAGLDIYLSRFSKGLLLQTYLDYVRTSGEINYLLTKNETFHANEFTLKVGPAYQFPIWKVQPRISLGVSATLEKNDIHYDYHIGKVNLGDYFGLGVYIPLSKGALLVDAEYAAYGTWQYGYKRRWNANMSKLGFSVGYQF